MKILALALIMFGSPAYAVYSSTTAKTTIRAAIDSSMGPIPPGLTSAEQAAQSAARDNLAAAIESLGTYIKGNMQVVSGIPVSTTGSSTAQTGSTTSAGTLQ